MSLKTEIPLKEIRFHQLSTFDENGKLFEWKGEYFRAIGGAYLDVCLELFEKGIVERLVGRGLLVETERTDFVLPGYPLVLRHRKIPFVSYPYEWSPEMLKAAALAILNLEIELAREGFELQDGHPFNMLFDGFRPVFVDFTSIVKIDESEHLWRAYEEYCAYFLRPLKLMEAGCGKMARKMMAGFFSGIDEDDFNRILRGPFPKKTAWPRNMRHKAKSALKAMIPLRYHAPLIGFYRCAKAVLPREKNPLSVRRLNFLEVLKNETSGISFPKIRTEWSHYYEDRFMPLEISDDWTLKHRSVHQILSELRPESVLDIGSNRGWYSQLASKLGARVVGFDEDEVAVDRLFEDAGRKKMDILPLMMDVRNPSPGYGFNHWLCPATKRLKCDMVMALALVHHLAFHKFRLDFEQIVEAFSVFSDRWLLTEFIPLEDSYVRQWRLEGCDWYAEERFIEALRRKYRRIQIYPSAPGPRHLILCEK